MTKATAIPKKMGSREKGFWPFFFLFFLLRPGFWVPIRRASPVRILLPDLAAALVPAADFAAGFVLFTTRLIFLSGLSWALRYSYAKRAEGLRLKASMASSISWALW